jgi:hypothetical protein
MIIFCQLILYMANAQHNSTEGMLAEGRIPCVLMKTKHVKVFTVCFVPTTGLYKEKWGIERNKDWLHT